MAVISWQSVLLVEETQVPRENHHWKQWLGILRNECSMYIYIWIYNTYSIQYINFVCRISLYMYIEVTLRWRTSIDKKKLTFYSTEIIYTHFKLLLLKFWITCGWSSRKNIMVYICVHIKCMYFYTDCKIWNILKFNICLNWSSI
jgi:hypothetical protein